jgi:hypothetical protein
MACPVSKRCLAGKLFCYVYMPLGLQACTQTSIASSLTIECREVCVDDGVTHQLLLVVV